jgi:hypothetical protein
VDLAEGLSLRPYGEGFDILNAAGQVIGNVAPPWAVDTVGRMLPTGTGGTGVS